MIILWSSLAGLLLYMEFVYHFAGYGWDFYNPVYAMAMIAAWAGTETLLIGILRGRIKRICYQMAIWLPVVWTSAQLVYLRIFKQPLLMEAVFRGGGDALSNYWREALNGILKTLPYIVLLILPAVVWLIVKKKLRWKLPDFHSLQILRTAFIIALGVAGNAVIMGVGQGMQAEYYEDYTEFYDPLTIARTMGVLPTLQRDTLGRFFHGLIDSITSGDRQNTKLAEGETSRVEQDSGSLEYNLSGRQNGTGENTPPENLVNTAEGESGESNVPEEGGEEGNETVDEEVPEEPLPYPQQFDLDYDLLHELADNDAQSWLADYIEGLTPVNSNEYTGRFEGYNLIYLTAEGFSTYAINEELTPTLYRLTHSGFVFENYYVPLWQTSTSDGEYINCTALIPDGQFSMRKSAQNNMAFVLPRLFEKEGVYSWAYHDNSLDYYERHQTHPNLGYDFKACKLGKLSEAEWGDRIFPMEHPTSWPASDLEMMEGTMPEYVEQERFHVYYMTVSGHMYYSFTGNSMSYKNRDAVSGLEMSENAQAYIACNIELDKALEYMLKKLEEAGQLDKTVICLSADHYPYEMTMEQYEELAGKPLSEGMDLYRNSLILWNAGMEEEPVYVEKACGPMDILPTLLNLFGFDYDSRMYAGRDILSEEEGMVIFNDRSYVTDSAIYKKGNDIIWLQDSEGNDLIPEEEKEAYAQDRKQEVKDRYQFSAYILRENYYQDILQSMIVPPEEEALP